MTQPWVYMCSPSRSPLPPPSPPDPSRSSQCTRLDAWALSLKQGSPHASLYSKPAWPTSFLKWKRNSDKVENKVVHVGNDPEKDCPCICPPNLSTTAWWGGHSLWGKNFYWDHYLFQMSFLKSSLFPQRFIENLIQKIYHILLTNLFQRKKVLQNKLRWGVVRKPKFK